jgi:hypothetical protein
VTVACRKQSPGILKVNLSQRKQHRDCRNNDDKGHKREISRVDSFFALQVGLVQISHRNLPLPTKAALSIRRFNGKIAKLTYKFGPVKLTSEDHQIIQHALAKARD